MADEQAQQRIAALMQKKADLEEKKKKLLEMQANRKKGGAGGALMPAHLSGDSDALAAMRKKIEELKVKNAALLEAKKQQVSLEEERKKIDAEEA